MRHRFLRHLLHLPFQTRRAFPGPTRHAITQAIAEGEASHRGEIRFVVEGSWVLGEVWAGKAVKDRALEVFGLSRAWDTAENTGVLVYALLCERQVHILADRGINAAVPPSTWVVVCEQLREDYGHGDFEAGSVAAIRSISTVLAQHFPAGPGNPNELPDEPVILR